MRSVMEVLFHYINKSTSLKPLLCTLVPMNAFIAIACAIHFAGPHSPGWLFAIVAIGTYTTIFPQLSLDWMNRKPNEKFILVHVNWYPLVVCLLFSVHASIVTLVEFGNWQTTSTCFVTCIIISVFVNVCDSFIQDLQHMAEVLIQNRQLEESKKHAEEESEQKTVFIAKVSHELRTPLHAIICSCDLVQDTQLTEEQRGYLKIVSKSSHLLLQLINNILDLSKYEAGKIILEERNFSLKDCMENIVNTMVTKSSEKKNKPNITLRIDKDVPDDIVGDETRITQVLMNLIGNGLKFHPKTRPAEIEVAVSREEKFIQFDVSDNGIGIKHEAQPLLFQQFVQLSDETTRLYGGTGLGLSICKNFIESMGGSLWLRHSLPNKGSIFSFKIPINVVVETAISPIAGEDLPRKRSMSVADLSGCKVLVAEDNAINRKIIRKMLESIGLVAVVLVEDGVQAVQEFMTQQFDLVILDVGMPKMGGIQAAAAMREFENKTNVKYRTPIMACTADVTISKQEECYRAGMDHVAIKPIVKETIRSVIVKLTQESFV